MLEITTEPYYIFNSAKTKGCAMKKNDNVIKDHEVFEALSKVGRLYEDYLAYQEFSKDESLYSGWNDYNRDINYPLGLTFKN